MSESQKPRISKEGDVTVISLGPEYENLDQHGLDELQEILMQETESADPPLAVLDLSHTKFFGSAFIEVVFRVWNRMDGREGGKFVLSGLTEYCREVLEVTHLDSLWDIYPSLEEALKALSDSP